MFQEVLQGLKTFCKIKQLPRKGRDRTRKRTGCRSLGDCNKVWMGDMFHTIAKSRSSPIDFIGKLARVDRKGISIFGRCSKVNRRKSTIGKPAAPQTSLLPQGGEPPQTPRTKATLQEPLERFEPRGPLAREYESQ